MDNIIKKYTYMVKTNMYFMLNKFWRDNDPKADETMRTQQECFKSFALEMAGEDRTMVKCIYTSPFTDKLNFFFDGQNCRAWFFFECCAQSTEEAEAITELCAEKLAKRIEEFGARLIKIKTEA